MNYYRDRTISWAWEKAENLLASVGDAPEVQGLCPLKDNCDVCKKARREDVRYKEHMYAKWAAQFVIENVRTMSHIESSMGTSGATKEQCDKFYDEFDKEFAEVYKVKSALVSDYLQKKK